MFIHFFPLLLWDRVYFVKITLWFWLTTYLLWLVDFIQLKGASQENSFTANWNDSVGNIFMHLLQPKLRWVSTGIICGCPSDLRRRNGISRGVTRGLTEELMISHLGITSKNDFDFTRQPTVYSIAVVLSLFDMISVKTAFNDIPDASH